MKELGQIKKHLSSLLKQGSAQVWAGDFNALTLEDYPSKQFVVVAIVNNQKSRLILVNMEVPNSVIGQYDQQGWISDLPSTHPTRRRVGCLSFSTKLLVLAVCDPFFSIARMVKHDYVTSCNKTSFCLKTLFSTELLKVYYFAKTTFKL